MSDSMSEADVTAAMSRISNHDAERLNAVAGTLSAVLGYVRFSHRYAIAVLALEELDRILQRKETP